MRNKEQQGPRAALARATVNIFEPLARLLLRYGISYKTCAQWLRWCYVDVAQRYFRLAGRKQSKSRIAVLTGLSRVEVDRLLNSPRPEAVATDEPFHRGARVLAGWAHDSDFTDQQGEPRVLAFDEGQISFTELVNRYSGGAPPRAILDELQRVGSVEVSEDRQVRFKDQSFITREQQDLQGDLDIVGFSASRLINTLDHNLDPESENKRLQLVTFYHDIPADKLAEAQEYIRSRGVSFVKEIDSYLFELRSGQQTDDHAVNRAGMGIYYFQDDEKSEMEQ